MNQRNIFTIIGAILVLQGITFYLMGSKIISSAFPNLDEAGRFAPVIMLEVMAVLSIALGLIAYASRNHPDVVWAFCIGFTLFVIVSLKHLLVDDINVPIPALAIQIGIVLASAYLWMQGNKTREV